MNKCVCVHQQNKQVNEGLQPVKVKKGRKVVPVTMANLPTDVLLLFLLL